MHRGPLAHILANTRLNAYEMPFRLLRISCAACKPDDVHETRRHRCRTAVSPGSSVRGNAVGDRLESPASKTSDATLRNSSIIEVNRHCVSFRVQANLLYAWCPRIELLDHHRRPPTHLACSLCSKDLTTPHCRHSPSISYQSPHAAPCRSIGRIITSLIWATWSCKVKALDHNQSCRLHPVSMPSTQRKPIFERFLMVERRKSFQRHGHRLRYFTGARLTQRILEQPLIHSSQTSPKRFRMKGNSLASSALNKTEAASIC